MSGESDPEENCCFFGKPLDPYDEDAFPKKKPISVEDQIATDAQGRRRFHGAFTGGFSAGFYNTVGSLEGWTPSEFISTRKEKAQNFIQQPQDFMDDEDLGEHGIAPQTVRATNEYSNSKKRRRAVFNDGPIPGEPVLETLLMGGNETIGYLLLKNIGIQEKINKRDEELGSSTTKTYGCQMPTGYRISENIERRQYEIHIMYKENLTNPKSNSFGLGYQGLDREHVNLFESTNLVVQDKNKKLSIGGQAFGVGAFEEDDEDIYIKEDMSNYDFELTKEKKSNKQKGIGTNLVFEMFIQSKTPLINKKLFSLPNIPHSFTGKHKIRKSRFEPIEVKSDETDRSRINPAVRAKYLGENENETYTKSKPIIENPMVVKEETNTKKQFDLFSLMSDRFVSASQKEDVNDVMEPVEKMETTHGTKEMREAARMKMFGPLTRITEDWHPCTMLCKRFNVPEPFMDKPEKNRKRTKNLIFENQKYADDEVLLKPGITGETDVLEERDTFEKTDSECIDSKEVTVTPIPSILDSNEVLETEQMHNVAKDIKQENDLTPAVDITDKIGLAEKTDLFKAVFLYSSESEDDGDEKQIEQVDKTEELKAVVLSEALIPKFQPLKQGILSHVNAHIFTKPENKGVEEQTKPENNFTDNPRDKIDVSLYGPALPIQKLHVPSVTTMSNSSDDEWVEKDRDHTGTKSRHKKKKKKDKYKKHKREKKSKR